MANDDGWLLAGPTAPDDVRQYYDDWADEYDAQLRAWGYDAPERAARLVLDTMVASGIDGAVLDAGCGTGLTGAALRNAGYLGRLVGIDISAASLEVAARREAYDATRVVDLQQPLPEPDRAFDAVVCVGVLTYVPDTSTIWRELARVVRPGGVVACTQRADVWHERRCADVLDRLERDGVWTAIHLSPAVDYMPGHPEFGTEIGVRYLAARVHA